VKKLGIWMTSKQGSDALYILTLVLLFFHLIEKAKKKIEVGGSCRFGQKKKKNF
jgi:hypothetical protein